MSGQATISIDRDIVTAATDRAKQGLTIEDYVMQVLLRDMERDPGERNILAYDAAGPGSQFMMTREEGESDEHYEIRSSTLRMLFP
ncbi:hypothetical protein [Bradyrhizobium japonicum]|uniref:hypothetical protein n=1 Tax=Bradyrhizobium japonicum TaxID=375 RepID=UPI0004853D45|nr:hypothetical protein [Bradyrhizobium japonicum]WLB88042.1 hypothetical protein QIH91_36085 [Bradyrhizobium japonicum USDA 135]